MKLKDQNKPRKRINIIDVIVIVLLLAAVAFLVFRGISLYQATQVLEVEHKDTNENARAMPENFTPNIRVTLVSRQVDRKLAERIETAEFLRIYNTFSLLDAYISNIELKPSELVSVNAQGKSVITRSKTKVDIYFTVDAQVDLANPDAVIEGNFNPMIGGTEMRVGKSYVLKTMEIEVSTQIIDVEILYDAP